MKLGHHKNPITKKIKDYFQSFQIAFCVLELWNVKLANVSSYRIMLLFCLNGIDSFLFLSNDLLETYTSILLFRYNFDFTVTNYVSDLINFICTRYAWSWHVILRLRLFRGDFIAQPILYEHDIWLRNRHSKSTEWHERAQQCRIITVTHC